MSDIKMIKMNCPSCDSVLDIEDGLNTFYCKYCGTRIVLSGEEEHVINARVKVMELAHAEKLEDKKNEQERYKMQFEAEKKQKEEKQGWRLILIYIFALVTLIYCFAYLPHRREIRRIENVYEEIQTDINEENYEIALIKLDQMDYHADWGGEEVKLWEGRKKELYEIIKEKMKANQIQVPLSSYHSIGKQYEIVQSLFEDAGFSEVKVFELDEKPGLFHEKGEVKSITVNGDGYFSSDATYNPDSPVLIFYYSYK